MQEKEYTWCFACGKDNPIGLKMEFTMPVHYQGSVYVRNDDTKQVFYQLCPDDHKYIERWQVLPYALL